MFAVETFWMGGGYDPSFIVAFSPTAMRTDYGEPVGFNFIADADIVVTALGRWVYSGNSQAHTVRIALAGSPNTVIASASVPTAGRTVGAFSFTQITPVTLVAGTHYVLLTQEFAGGDTWSDQADLTNHSPLARILGPSYDAAGVPQNLTATNVGFAPPSFQYTQKAYVTQTDYRFRNDDGTESTATWLAALNTPVTIVPGVNFRVRVRLAELGDQTSTIAGGFLEQSVNNGAWVAVEDTSINGPVEMALSSNISDSTTTQQIGTGTFVAGRLEEAISIGAPNVDLTALSTTEYEFNLVLANTAVSGNTIRMRLSSAGGSLQGYPKLPTLTVGATPGSTIKVYNGATWDSKPLRRWNGSAWVPAVLKRWDGSAWVQE